MRIHKREKELKESNKAKYNPNKCFIKITKFIEKKKSVHKFFHVLNNEALSNDLTYFI